MMYSVFDVAQDVTRKLPIIKAAGITDIIRYDDRFSAWKQVGVDEVKAISDADINVGIVYEHGAAPSGRVLGAGDAHHFLRMAERRKQPAGSAEYFAVDHDVVSVSELNNGILPYFEAIAEVLHGTGFRVGVYGSGLVCKTLKQEHLVTLTWPTCSRGFTGSREYVASRAWDIWQVECDVGWHGLSIDWDDVNNPNWGQFRYGGNPVPPGPPLPGPIPSPLRDTHWIQASLNKLGAAPQLAVDGLMGPATRAAIKAFQQSNNLDTDGICGPLTTAAIEAKLPKE